MKKREDLKPSILANEAVTVTFYDVNRQEVAKLDLRTNEFGTFNGEFTAPAEGLRGSMHISSSIGNSRKFFRVEEYKRPKFEVEFDQLKDAVALGDQVTMEGQAKAFAGFNIDGAKVKYRVVRQVRYPWLPWWMRSMYFPRSGQQMEIAFGETSTDVEGKFSINFEVIADPSVSKDHNPAFTFTVYADVTDITGETQSTSRSINLGLYWAGSSFEYR